MNKVIGFSLLILFGILYYYNMTAQNIELGIERPQPTTEYEKIKELNFDANYPKDPTKVVEAYTRIKEFIYGGSELTNEELEEAIYRQRKLFDKKLLELNSERTQNEAVMAEITDLKEKKQKIVEIKVKNKTIDYEDEAVDIETIEYTGIHKKNNYIVYTLRKDNMDKWKIYGWVDEPVRIIDNKEIPPYEIKE